MLAFSWNEGNEPISTVHLQSSTVSPLTRNTIRYHITLPRRGVSHTHLIGVPHDLVNIRCIHRCYKDAVCGDQLEQKSRDYPKVTIDGPCCVCEYLLPGRQSLALIFIMLCFTHQNFVLIFWLDGASVKQIELGQ